MYTRGLAQPHPASLSHCLIPHSSTPPRSLAKSSHRPPIQPRSCQSTSRAIPSTTRVPAMQALPLFPSPSKTQLWNGDFVGGRSRS
ncbi:hypothetical protein BDV98DRAFT_560507 [Pterulicium gracile]|uniref:Uncharacterized protein n=1 Tax=Pterulicium gracile TaxID=1884261 RepID=A0A5C3QZI8_9AGAR|nr:hypothetical protein BDV98DRAFT_560507 [Pterula gracilis]